MSRRAAANAKAPLLAAVSVVATPACSVLNRRATDARRDVGVICPERSAFLTPEGQGPQIATAKSTDVPLASSSDQRHTWEPIRSVDGPERPQPPVAIILPAPSTPFAYRSYRREGGAKSPRRSPLGAPHFWRCTPTPSQLSRGSTERALVGRRRSLCFDFRSRRCRVFLPSFCTTPTDRRVSRAPTHCIALSLKLPPSQSTSITITHHITHTSPVAWAGLIDHSFIHEPQASQNRPWRRLDQALGSHTRPVRPCGLGCGGGSGGGRRAGEHTQRHTISPGRRRRQTH